MPAVRAHSRVASSLALPVSSSDADTSHSTQSKGTPSVTDFSCSSLAIHAVAGGGEAASPRTSVVLPVAQAGTSCPRHVGRYFILTRTTSLDPEWLILTAAGKPQNVFRPFRAPGHPPLGLFMTLVEGI